MNTLSSITMRGGLGVLAMAVVCQAAPAKVDTKTKVATVSANASAKTVQAATNDVVPAAAVPANAPAPNLQVVAAARTRQNLDASLKELSALRESIAAEKIPLAGNLAKMEEQLSEARKDYDKAKRAGDNLNLELSNVKAEAKQLAEEVQNTSNLLDEYARAFEGRLNVGELPKYRPQMEAALLAPQNKDLTADEKLNRQLALVKASLTRIEELMGGVRFEGEVVDPKGLLTKGRFALIGPIAVFAPLSGGLAGFALPQVGSVMPVLRPIDEQLGALISQVANTGRGLLPLDPTRGDALKALIAKGSLWGYFKKGGPIMWPLLFVSLLAVTVVLERVTFLFLEGRRRNPKVVRAMLHSLEHGDIQGAIQAGEGSRDYVARCLNYALRNRDKSVTDALMKAAAAEVYRFTRGVAILDTVVTMSPLLGLLGTVTGMIAAFGMLGGEELGAPAAITGGIAEALIATTFGLGIAIVTLIPLSYLHSKCEQAQHEIEDATTHMELLMKPILAAEHSPEAESKG